MLGPARFDRGSSPLARGLREPALVLVDPTGIIPARAGFTADPREIRSRERDHPRSRGVYGSVGSVTSSAVGSSPLARGLRQLGGLDVDGPRIIPARAGFTEDIVAVLPFSQDHPRSRGVYGDSSTDDGVGAGSSPLARGLHFGEDALILARRIIPARAGFTGGNVGSALESRDHPRSRGVYGSRLSVEQSALGSSPLARGLQIGRQIISVERRIIPARAGFTNDLLDPEQQYSGSSPLARGLHPRVAGSTVTAGIIPARAGFTSRATCPPTISTDHPRSRGVYLSPTRSERSRPGSSPLARGLPHAGAAADAEGGIIPARAGFTRRGRSTSCPSSDHPRSRGVYRRILMELCLARGSSPLARGLPVGGAGLEDRGGIIPARAGFTSPGGQT